jgi:cytochrome b subunit of formate dehydrogenase
MPKGPLIYRQRLITRVTHWIWAVCLFFLLLTGLQIFNAFPSLHIGKESGFDYDNAVFAIETRQNGLDLQGNLTRPASSEPRTAKRGRFRRR